MARIGVNASENLDESVQGQPVSNASSKDIQKGSTTNKMDEKKQVISSTDMPSQINDAKKISENKDGGDKSTEMKKPNKLWLWIIIALFVLGGLAATYFLVLKDKLLA